MRCLCFLFVLFLQFDSLHSQPESFQFNNKDSTYIIGSIKNYNGQEEFVSYFLTDLLGSTKKHLSRVDNNGGFRFAFFQEYDRDFAIRYGKNKTAVFSKPGDTISIFIDQVFAEQPYQVDKAFTVVAEDNFSNEISIFFAEYFPFEHKRAAKKNNFSSQNSYVQSRLKNLDSDLKFLEEISTKRLLTPEFKAWGRNWLTYRTAYLISGVPFSFLYQEISNKSYVKMFGSIAIDNETAMNCSQYLNFLQGLSRAYLTMSSNKNKMTAGSTKPIKDARKYCEINHSGVTRQLIFAGLQKQFDKNEIKYYQPEELKLSNHITYSAIKLQLEAKSSSLQQSSNNVISEIKSHNASDSTKVKITSILNQYKDRYLFIDFWGSWCFNCLAEMPAYKTIIPELKNLPVSFLFLSVETSDEDVDEAKKIFAIDGEFYNLDGNETDLLNDVFNFSTYPAHFIITPDQKIIRIPYPSFNSLVEEIKRIVD